MRYAQSTLRRSLYRFRVGFIWFLFASLLLALHLPVAIAGGMRSKTAEMSALGHHISAIQSLGTVGGTWLLHKEGLRLDVNKAHDAQLDGIFQEWQKQPIELTPHRSSSLQQLTKTIRSRARRIATHKGVDYYELSDELMTVQFSFCADRIRSAILAVRQDESHWTVFTASVSEIAGPHKPVTWQAFSGNTIASRLDRSGQIVAKVITTPLDNRKIASSYLAQGWHQELAAGSSFHSTFNATVPLVFRRGTGVVTVAASSIPRAETLVLLIQGERP